MQQHHPRFSIIVPIYKVEAYLTECIESILGQSFEDFELILVDDGSPDQCPSICDRYQALDHRVQVIHKKNGGLVSARKAGIRQSRGQYILNVDGDDRIEDGMLHQIDAVIRQHGEPDMVSFGYQHITEEGEEISWEYDQIPEGEYSARMGNLTTACNGFLLTDSRSGRVKVSTFCHAIWSKAIRRELAVPMQEAVPERIRNGEDAAVVIPAAFSSSVIVVIHDALYHYRIRRSSLVHSLQTDKMERLTDFVDYMRGAAPMLPEKNLIHFTFDQIEKYLIQAARGYISYAEFRQAAEKCVDAGAKGALDTYKAPEGTKASHRFRAWFTKRRWFWMYWLIYHRR